MLNCAQRINLQFLISYLYFGQFRTRRQNRISRLPANMEAMSSLQVLSLSSNLLEELPDSIANLHR